MISVTSAQIGAWLAMFVWPFVRILALLMAAPVINAPNVPAQVKIGLALAVTVIVAPTLPPEAHPAVSSSSVFALMAQQIVVGVALGFAMQVVFAAVELAGDMLGLQMGLSFAGFVDPSSNDQSPLVGSFLGLLATLMFLSINGHLAMIAAIVDSFTAVPIAPTLEGGLELPRLAAWGGELFRLGLQLSLPVLATMLLVNLALGVLARAAPQLNVFAVGFPITLVVGFTVLAAALPYFGPALTVALERGLALTLR
jgi:flagellar biosynthetic protein FliR